ncbi:MAG: FAD-binding protein [Candidatus Syntrophonatronum acetioxidans]|uniref:FAD-binding protein n=1 Tax=Candidatus Syntrophonatronum acetioxidans TaxID=1795816 RepID=A0A424YFS9_9FIRM|nr:MAG: FAD-binding protein [Candidatus Syntrophonatronum acetioxidans]
MSALNYDVIIVGAGPAGIFAALELCKNNGYKVLMLEKGKDIRKRRCPHKDHMNSCLNCGPCSIISGWGGAGAFSDGKLTLTSEIGGFLSEYLPRERVEELIAYIDQTFLSYGASREVFGGDPEENRRLHKEAAAADLFLIPSRVRHMGTENCFKILCKMRDYLDSRIDIIPEEAVKNFIVEGGKIAGVQTVKKRSFYAPYVVCAPGREGAEWIYHEAQRLNLSGVNNPVDIGVRVELPAVILEHITEKVYESKLIYYSGSFDDRVRTFCMNPYGEVVMENNDGLITVNGHSYAEQKSDNTNFAILVSKTFTEPFKEPITYGKYIASLANMLGGGVLVQRLGDLLVGRRSTGERMSRGMVNPTLKNATPGDLSLVLPYRHLVSILEMLKVLDKIAPGVYSRHTLLYGVEVKFYSFRLSLKATLETEEIDNFFVIGDGAGITRGLAQASASGVVAAREILQRCP